MLKHKGFLEDEANAPLLRLNKDDFLSKLDVDARAASWKKFVFPNSNTSPSSDQSLVKTTEEEKLDPERIIIMDAERTFAQKQTKEKLIKFLTVAQHRLKGDYHQALSYVSGLLLLVTDEQTAMEIVLELSRNERYLPGYFKAEPIAAATDSYVFQHILGNVFPDVQAFLLRQGVFPENYFQKWAVGLFTQILPPESLFSFFDLFLQHGYPFLFQFGLALIEGLKDQLLKIPDFATIFGLLRLDPKYVLITTGPNQFEDSKLPKIDTMAALNRALTYDLSSYNFAELRQTLFDKHLKERLQRANEYHKKDVSDDESLSEEEDNEGEDCDFCHEFFPEYFCKECNSKICENCHTEHKNDHKASHKVVPYEPKEAEEESEEELEKEMEKLSIKK